MRGLRLSVALLSTLTLVAGSAAAGSSPNGSRTAVGKIAFTVQHGDGDAPWDVYVIRTDGRWVLKKTTTRLNEADPVWSPDGRHIAFDGWTIPGGADTSIYTMNPDGTHRRRLARGDVPQWSPDGRRIAYINDGIDVMNVDGTGKKHLARGGDPRWSPDGKQIAFTGVGESTNDVYIVDASSGRKRRLTRTRDSTLAAWAPGRKIIFTRGIIFDNGAGSATGIYIINADGTGRRLARRTSAYVPTSIGGWSPDDKLILYATRQGISTWRLSDGSVRRLTRGGSDSYPTWGPHGGRIAFARNTPHGNGIFIMNRDGSAVHRLAVIGPIPHTFGWNRYFTLTWAPR